MAYARMTRRTHLFELVVLSRTNSILAEFVEALLNLLDRVKGKVELRSRAQVSSVCELRERTPAAEAMAA